MEGQPQIRTGKKTQRTFAERRIVWGFAFIIGLMCAVVFYAAVTQNHLARQAEQIHEHPLAVTTAVGELMVGIVSVHSSLADAALAKSDEDRTKVLLKLEQLHQQTLEQFTLLDERFLGDQDEIDELKEAYLKWVPLREKVEALILSGNAETALALTRLEGTRLVADQTVKAQRLADFADTKAREFLDEATSSRRTSLIAIVVVLAIIVALSVWVARHAVRRLQSFNNEVFRYLSLVDQNIMTASLTAEGALASVTNALCRKLGLARREILGAPGGLQALGLDTYPEMRKLWLTVNSGARCATEVDFRAGGVGEPLWLGIRAVPEEAVTGAVAGCSLFFLDITDRKQVEELSLTDQLTGLHNRRHFESVLDRELRIARRSKGLLTLAIIDVDCFKGYNDTFGHPAGDRVLTRVAQTLRTALRRPTDHVFRIGGEEFAALFGATDLAQSRRFLDGLRQAVENLGIEHLENSAGPVVTVTAGASVCSGGPHLTAHLLTSEADRALYEGKRQRNVVVVNELNPASELASAHLPPRPSAPTGPDSTIEITGTFSDE